MQFYLTSLYQKDFNERMDLPLYGHLVLGFHPCYITCYIVV